MPRLTDPWFAAEFYGEVSETGHRRQGDKIEGAQGLFLWCPCAYGHDHKAHGLIVPFKNPRNAPDCPPEHGPHPARNAGAPRPRWHMTGSSLADLTLTPSVAVGSNPECWHGWFRDGEVVT